MKFFNFFTLFFLIILLGCTQEQGSTTNVISKSSNGLSVINFTSNYRTLRVNEQTNIQLLLENHGFFDARDIRTIFYGEGLLVRENEFNSSELILPDKQDILFWTLRVPLSLSKTESTSYTIGSRIYYNYNFSGTKQVGFVPSSYSGGDLPLSSTNRRSPLSVVINANNPVRTFRTGSTTNFTITAIISRIDDGSVDYFNCNVYGDNPCNKGGYINSFRLTVPLDWVSVSDLSVWSSSVDEVNGEKTYSIYYDDLLGGYNQLRLNDSTPCSVESGTTWCYSCVKRKANYDNEANTLCLKTIEALNNLRMIRGDEVRLVLQFGKPTVDEVIIDNIMVEGDFGYKIDVSDFMSKINLLILGD